MSVAGISASLQAALASANYIGSTSSSQVRADLTAIVNNLNAVIPPIQSLPIKNIPTTQIMIIVPQGIEALVSFVRATSSLKNLAAPLTPEEGSAFLAIIQNIQTKIIELLNIYNLRIPAAEAAIPGLNNFGLNKFKGFVQLFLQAFGAAAPSNVPRSTLQGIQSNIDLAIQNSLSRVPA